MDAPLERIPSPSGAKGGPPLWLRGLLTPPQRSFACLLRYSTRMPVAENNCTARTRVHQPRVTSAICIATMAFGRVAQAQSFSRMRLNASRVPVVLPAVITRPTVTNYHHRGGRHAGSSLRRFTLWVQLPFPPPERSRVRSPVTADFYVRTLQRSPTQAGLSF